MSTNVRKVAVNSNTLSQLDKPASMQGLVEQAAMFEDLPGLHWPLTGHLRTLKDKTVNRWGVGCFRCDPTPCYTNKTIIFRCRRFYYHMVLLFSFGQGRGALSVVWHNYKTGLHGFWYKYKGSLSGVWHKSGDVFTVTGHINCGLSLSGRKINANSKILPLPNNEEE